MSQFAFYGRGSTEDQQAPTSSRNWQLARSRQVIEPTGGEIVEEFFDIGQSRSLPWKRRPESSRLLDTFKDTGRGFGPVGFCGPPSEPDVQLPLHPALHVFMPRLCSSMVWGFSCPGIGIA